MGEDRGCPIYPHTGNGNQLIYDHWLNFTWLASIF